MPRAVQRRTWTGVRSSSVHCGAPWWPGGLMLCARPHTNAALTHSAQLHETTPFARTHTYSRVLRNTASTGEFSLAHNTRPHAPTHRHRCTNVQCTHRIRTPQPPPVRPLLRLFRKSAYRAHVSHATPSAQAQRGGTAGATHLVPRGSVWHFCAWCRWRPHC